MTILLLSMIGMTSVGVAAYFVGFNKGFNVACEEMVALSNKIKSAVTSKSELLSTEKTKDYETFNKTHLN